MADTRATKLFAWDGLEMPAPADWDLSGFVERRRVVSVTLEDSTAVRLEIDWTAAAGPRQADHVKNRHASLAESLHGAALSVEALNDFPADWVVFLYTLPESARLITALYAGTRFPVFVFARFHATDNSRRVLLRQARTAIEGFRYRGEGPIAWKVFDLSWRVPRRFRLTETSFLAGRKMMVFEHGLRRLFLWRLSLADRLLRARPAAEVAAEFLNRFKGLPGARFKAAGTDRLLAARNPWYPLGHYEEIGRGCFRYAAGLDLHPAGNSMTIRVFHYRRAEDIGWLEGLSLE